MHPGLPGTRHIDQVGFELNRDLPTSASLAGIKDVCHHAGIFTTYYFEHGASHFHVLPVSTSH